MRLTLGSLVAIAGACLIGVSFGDIAYSQTSRFNCKGVEAECLVSETPVPGVRMVREKDYFKRPAHYLSSNLYTTLASGRETGNRFVAFDFKVAPFGGPLPHTHRNEWESFFVDQGSVTFTVGVEDRPPFRFIEQDVPAGTVIYGPVGPVHGFINKNRTPARIFSFAMPAGLDNFFHVAGEEVTDWNAPIPPITLEEIVRTAFWAEQRGDALHIPGTPAPMTPFAPEHVAASVTGADRPRETGPFGETRVVLLTPNEVGTLTGATAFCGPGFPGRAGGTVKYSYFSLPNDGTFSDFKAMHISQNTEVFYTLGGTLSLRFGEKLSTTRGMEFEAEPLKTVSNPLFALPPSFMNRVVKVEPLTYIEIDPGVPFSIANTEKDVRVQSLAISVISPICPPSPFPQP